MARFRNLTPATSRGTLDLPFHSCFFVFLFLATWLAACGPSRKGTSGASSSSAAGGSPSSSASSASTGRTSSLSSGGTGGSGAGGTGGTSVGGTGGMETTGTGGGGCAPGAPCDGGVCGAKGDCLAWGGAFEVSDPWSIPCANGNAFTGACSCPMGFSKRDLRVLNDSGGGPHGGVASYCALDALVPGSEWGGAYQVDDPVAGGLGCRAPNPLTGGCTCPGGFAAVGLRTLADSASGAILGSSVGVCMVASAGPKVFGGAYQMDDPSSGGLGCRSPNPSTGGCSCPAGTVAQPLRVIADTVAGGQVGSHFFLCGMASSIAVFSSPVELCKGVLADSTGQASATLALQTCIDATPKGGALEIPAGTYLVDAQLVLPKAITLRTAGTAGSLATCVQEPSLRCAVLQAAPSLDVLGGFVHAGGTAGVALDHVVLDGNRNARLASAAAQKCAQLNRWGFNASFGGCTSCSFTYSASMNALCGTGFEWLGDGAQIIGSVFRNNGSHTPSGDGATRWSDGLTLLQSDGATVAGNVFVDNTDVSFISGGAKSAVFQNNILRQVTVLTFAGLMLDNFNGGTSGDFTGTVVSGNDIDCTTGLCYFAVEVGPHPWYPSANVAGGQVTGNTIANGQQPLNADGAGTQASPVQIFGNVLTGQVPGALVCGNQPVSALFNISPDSVVDRQGEAFATSAKTHKICF